MLKVRRQFVYWLVAASSAVIYQVLSQLPGAHNVLQALLLGFACSFLHEVWKYGLEIWDISGSWQGYRIAEVFAAIELPGAISTTVIANYGSSVNAVKEFRCSGKREVGLTHTLFAVGILHLFEFIRKPVSVGFWSVFSQRS